MTRYRKQPVEVSAIQIRAVNEHDVDILGGGPDTDEWLPQALEKGIGEEGGLWVVNDGLRIGTLEGVLRVNAGDYIVRGVEGEIYPVRGDIFVKTFAPVP
jgi:hypothetical protein